ncbi:hypothetical protein DYB32_009275 [Aphanomyces invadans]|uniref:Uncharacterized protein n=1 Tax=Aphanomyces invadans TaxID=157072 RepID=A0A418AIT7_9STRA|nr:hypothetical protein DYB32_009275 [Aphanomyces invadans]
METSMVLAQLKLPASDASHVATFLSDLRALAAAECTSAVIHTTLHGLPAALEKAVYVYEKYPLIIDETGQAAQFFKYQRGCFLLAGNPADVTAAILRRSLVGAGYPIAGLELDQFYSDTWFPSQVLDRQEFFKAEVWAQLLRQVHCCSFDSRRAGLRMQSEGDPEASLFLPSDSFKLVVLCGNIPPPPRTLERMCLVRVQALDANTTIQDDGGDVAAALGLKEVGHAPSQDKVAGTDVVEAGFDGDVATMTALVEKGFHIESEDGHRHTALSEAACQGHLEMLQYLLSLVELERSTLAGSNNSLQGANPNCVNDTGRSPLYRASYNGHVDSVMLLLRAGADPRICTKEG